MLEKLSKFCHAIWFNSDISRWNVSNVTDMSEMFAYAKRFNQDLSKWNVSNVEYMRCMFQGFLSFKQNITWIVKDICSTTGIFTGTNGKTELKKIIYFIPK